MTSFFAVEDLLKERKLRLSFVLNFLFLFHVALACTHVSNWTELVAEVTNATSHLVLCPFVINKEALDSPLQIFEPRNVSCETRHACIVRGPGTHVRIAKASSQLVISGFVFQQATTGSLVISASSLLQQFLFDCKWEENQISAPWNETLKDGGALIVQSDSRVSVVECEFVRNSALRGGAISHRGAMLEIIASTFVSNAAKVGGGGAIAVSSASSVLRVDSNTKFLGNWDESLNKSGAILVQNLDNFEIDSSTSGTSNDGCDGLFVLSRRVCILFTALQYEPGKLVVKDLGILLSQGLVADIIAKTEKPVLFTSPEAASSASLINFHKLPDGAAIVGLNESNGGGFVYVSNSEGYNSGGGVYGLYFDQKGRARDYRLLLHGTTWNCNGGLTPWETWVSCEEYPGGHCYQVDPMGARVPQQTVLGGKYGGQFEAMAVNNDNPYSPVFFVSEDKYDGAIRRFRPSKGAAIGWEMLHGNGTLDYLEFLPGNKFRWTPSIAAGRKSAYNYYWNVEGIAYRNKRLLFTSKFQKELFIVHLKKGTWTKKSTITSVLPGGGQLDGQPDQLYIDSANTLYIAEDGGSHPGIYVMKQNRFLSLLQMDDRKFKSDELTGVAFSPDSKFLFFCAQHNGILFRVRRLDGKPFDGKELLPWKVVLRP